MTLNYDVDSIYGRDALVLYLQDIRDLEVMKKMFQSKIVEGEHDLELNRRKYLTPNRVEIPQQTTADRVVRTAGKVFIAYFAIGAILVIFATAFVIMTAHGDPQTSDVLELNANSIVATIIGLVGILLPPIALSLLIVWIIKRRKKARDASVEDALRHNREDDERIVRNKEAFLLQFEQPWTKKREFLKSACQEVQDALDQDYALNITPLQYRNLEAAIYLYDFMSTSRQPFAQALDHAQIDDGIRRIESKLNIIISQNEAQLKQLTQIRNNTETIIQQENAILAAQVATAYYASSAAAHARSVDTKMSNMQAYIQYGF